ncbi:Endonuclease/exonuclease/phosphatase [Fimicolochytrium jonesii]|uniref:Endonuclease/exonuclease/phosphatase n=1 Tax=Fimicolochytrium jonesii TaxID=1396493 RepID=UPI0022FE2F02|nr:Endonuclease/exonuclease/phosphatase [Fimicolochytrium jonesii]KAI8816524.1 Endonuclease/exonuclease/phosphatase [Fimicolochytrium jonesii]
MMTYNCLAPSLCDANMYLYKSQQRAHGREVIDFYTRGPRLIKEIAAQDCDIICLQEVDERHFTSFYEPQLKTYGYEGTFVPCTGTKTDGSAILVKTSQFTMVEFRHVQYHPHKHNVGIVCILQSVKTGRPICITTTHILWSPKGGETKLAQLMLLMQNMKHLIEQHEVVYGMNLPVLLCGDFNINPGSFIYNFLRAGRADMKSAIPKTMSGQLADKRRGTGLAKATWSVIKGMFPLSVFAAFPQIGGDTTVQADGWLDWCSIPTYSGTAANGAWIHQPSDSGYPPDTSDAPLIARHPFHFLSVYAPYNDPTTGEPYFTTWHEADQEVVDFIFMGELRNEARSRATTTTRFVPGESTLSADGLNPSLSVTQADAAPQQMTLLECLRYLKPPRASETEKMPNANVPSDHVMLVAEFRLSGAKGFCEEFGDLGF